MGNENGYKENQNETVKDKESLLSQMHHDIRTPLNGITGLIYLMRQSLDNPQKTEAYLGKLESAAEELKKQMETIFQLSLLAEKGADQIRETIDLTEIAAGGCTTGQSVGLNEEQSLSGKRVLIVEDNEINLVITSEILEGWGCIITTARDGMEAVKKFRESREDTFDFILMDIRMPYMDGYEAAKNIRVLKRNDAQEVIIIALTANAYQTESERIKTAGMDGIITKPLHVSALKHLMCMKVKDKKSILN